MRKIRFGTLLFAHPSYVMNSAAVKAEELSNLHPLMTIVGGKITVLREEFAQELGRPAVGPQVEFRNRARYPPEEEDQPRWWLPFVRTTLRC